MACKWKGSAPAVSSNTGKALGSGADMDTLDFVGWREPLLATSNNTFL